MKNYIFLTETYSEGPTTYYAISPEKIKDLNVYETYSNYGQIIGHYNACDYHFENSESTAQDDCEKAIKEKFNVDVKFTEAGIVEEINGEEVEGVNNLALEIQEFISEWREQNEVLTTCRGFNL